MTRVLPASRAEVWRALTESDQLTGWWGPRGFAVPEADFEPRVGESFRLTMKPPDGDPFHLDGEFREVDPPSRLAYTFRWDPPDKDDRETLVTLSLEDRGAGTEVTFSQGEFATAARLELHRDGWSDSFEKLEDSLR